MARLPYPIYGLENLHLFQRYQTREDYQKATGAEPPPFDERKAPKYWFDPNAKDSVRKSVVYDNVVLVDERSGAAVPGPDGKPQLDTLLLSRDEAGTVNIPPNASNVPGTDVPEVPMPLRALEPGEELCFQFANVVAVRNVELFESLKEGFTAADRALIQSIARKLGA
jgi:hypothetical protein